MIPNKTKKQPNPHTGEDGTRESKDHSCLITDLKNQIMGTCTLYVLRTYQLNNSIYYDHFNNSFVPWVGTHFLHHDYR